MRHLDKRTLVDDLGHKVRDEVMSLKRWIDARGDDVDVFCDRVDHEVRNFKGWIGRRTAIRAFGPEMRDEVRFIRRWIDKPLQVGAVAPSSPELARRMAAEIDPDRPGLVVELGPGTGVVTEALLERGVAPERLVSIEYDPDFCTLLRRRHPGIHVVHGDAYRLRRAVEPLIDKRLDRPLAAVVSSLPLFTRPLAERIRLLDEAFGLMQPGAPFVQFSYALVPPVPRGAGRWDIARSGWVVKNLPPARVWTYRRSA